MTTPLDDSQILFGKLVGSVLGQRWGWVWLGAIYVIGVLTGGLNPLAVPFIMGAWLILATFCGVLGLWYSVTSKTTLRATVSTNLTALLVGGGHWLIWICCSCPMLFGGLRMGGSGLGDLVEWWVLFQVFGLTPPAMLGLLTIHYREFTFGGPYIFRMLFCAFMGCGVWAGASALLWKLTCRRFSERVRPQAVKSRPNPLPNNPGRAANSSPFP
jgi:hypothetical protein